MKSSYIKKMYPYLKPEKRKIASGLAASVLMNLFAVGITYQFSEVIDRHIAAADISGLLWTAARILLCTLMYFLCYVLFLQESKSAQYGVQHRLRKLVFSHVTECRYDYFVRKSFGLVNTNAVQDVEAFCSGIFEKLFGSIANILFFLITFAILLTVNLRITGVLLAYMAAVTVYMNCLKRVMVRYARGYSGARVRMNESVMDLTSHRKSIVLYGRRENYLNRVDESNRKMIGQWLRLNVFSPLIQSSIEVSILVSYLLAFAVGWAEMKAGRAGYGDVFLYLTYIPQLWNKYGSAIDVMAQIAQAEVYAERILKAVETEETEHEGEAEEEITEWTVKDRQGEMQGEDREERQQEETPEETPGGKQSAGERQEKPHDGVKSAIPNTGLQMIKMNFGFSPEHPLWQDFSADFTRPGIYALSGPSGCGKSTLFDLILGFYRPQSGKILICGVPIEEYRYADLRRTVVIVHQEPYFVTGSIWDNIRFFDESVTEAQMKEQLTRYGLYDLIAAMAAKGEILKREDARLTAGQRRLVSLARILVRKPKVILFDEVTAGLDSYTETLVLQVIRQAAKEHTCLMISHKESDLRIADKVIRL